MAKKKWIAVGLVAIVVVAVFVVWAKDAFVDSDGDGVLNVFDKYPQQYNFPATRYAKIKLAASNIDDELNVFDENLKLDPDEKDFIDYLATLTKFRQEEYIEIFLADDKLSEDEDEFIEFMQYIKEGLIPEDLEFDYQDYELTEIQSNLRASVLENDNVDEIEARVMVKLKTERWHIVKDIINSGMINSVYLNDNWDGDLKDGQPLSNLDEILQGTNPLNKLESNPNNLSNRYAVLAFTTASQEDENQLEFGRVSTLDAEGMYRVLRKDGYTDNNILLIIDPGPELGNDFLTSFRHIGFDFVVEYNNGQVVPGSRDELAQYFLTMTSNLPADENDMVFIYEFAHGSPYSILLGRSIQPEEFNEALQIRCAEIISIFSSCHSGGYISQIQNLNDNPNLLLIASCSEKEEGGMGGEFLRQLNEGLSVQESFGKLVSYDIDIIHPVMLSGRTEPFMNPLVYIRPELD